MLRIEYTFIKVPGYTIGSPMKRLFELLNEMIKSS